MTSTPSPPSAQVPSERPGAPARGTGRAGDTATGHQGSEASPDDAAVPRDGARTSGSRATRSREAATTVLRRWWPALTAASAAALTLAGGGDGGGLVFLLFTLPVMYLAVAVLDRPGTSWLMVALVIALHFLLEAAGLTPWPFVLGLGLLLVTAGLVLGPLRRPGVFALQVPALALFGGAGLLTLVVSPEAAVAVVAVGLLTHAAWDAVHWWSGKVISRSLAEWCMVYDTAVGSTVLVILLIRAF
ncbi:hypothetical protein [Nocardiopsis sp. NPDC058789]|uniref:hypothetical protein n=1 Tax=Nocardiopsis sp. NPDC058789 TaxID=3346634 RepID=UPI0036719CD2